MRHLREHTHATGISRLAARVAAIRSVMPAAETRRDGSPGRPSDESGTRCVEFIYQDAFAGESAQMLCSKSLVYLERFPTRYPKETSRTGVSGAGIDAFDRRRRLHVG